MAAGYWPLVVTEEEKFCQRKATSVAFFDILGLFQFDVSVEGNADECKPSTG